LYWRVNVLEKIKEAIALSTEAGMDWPDFRRFVKNTYFKQAIENCKGNQCRAAKRIHVHRNTIGRMTRELRG
jgi:DNA-binding NtrC family response regulator